MLLFIFTVIWCMIMSGMVITAVVLHDYILFKDYDIPETNLELKAEVLYARINEANEKYFPKPKKQIDDPLAGLRRKLFAKETSF